MKKLLLLSAILIFGCSSADGNDNNPGNTGNSFNPPNWIQGVWLNEAIPTVALGFEFRADDICNITGSQANCNKAIIELYENAPNAQTSVYEEISNTRYFVVFSYITLEQTWEFEKISANEINGIQGPSISTATIYTKQ
tara:strand:+ start:1027 stop:1443 length:417 start_codon:yes stop_codon:yes gene_type:complete